MSRRKKNNTPADTGQIQQGVVIRSTGYRSYVEVESGEILRSVVRGKFRLKGLKTTNPVAVGDQVKVLLPEEKGTLATIKEILPRKNYILRRAASHSHMVHVLCANVDQAVLVYSLIQPHTTLGFVNRFLVVAEAYHIPIVLLFNKTDLVKEEKDLEKLADITEMYRQIGYPIHHVSALDPESREEVYEIFSEKVSFVGGHSGVGKSTLINLIDPSLNLKTGRISDHTLKGKHTTVYAEMHPLKSGGYVIDSPGIREMGLTTITRDELSHYFPEMRSLLADCRFSNCLHLSEPGCAIKEGVESGSIHPSRYNSYVSMMEELE